MSSTITFHTVRLKRGRAGGGGGGVGARKSERRKAGQGTPAV